MGSREPLQVQTRRRPRLLYRAARAFGLWKEGGVVQQENLVVTPAMSSRLPGFVQILENPDGMLSYSTLACGLVVLIINDPI